MNATAVIYLKKLTRDEEFISYCRREIHEIIKDGYIDKESITSMIKIITYILEKESKHQVPVQIFTEVLEAFVIEILAKYGIQLSPSQYEHIVDEIENVLRNITNHRVVS